MNEKKEQQPDKVAEALKVLQEAETAKQQAFIEEYQALCNKHGMQIAPHVSLQVVKIQQP
jgi:DnaJ-domain-containing protein 1